MFAAITFVMPNNRRSCYSFYDCNTKMFHKITDWVTNCVKLKFL